MVVALICSTMSASAQKFRWDLKFDTRFDNREFKHMTYLGTVPSVTYFSARVVPVVGIGFGEHHRVMAGASYTADMGDRSSGKKLEPLLYWEFRQKRYGAVAGLFERRLLRGTYSRAIYAGSNAFYDNVLEGMATRFTPRNATFELVLDWDGEATETDRESFRVLSAGEYTPGWLKLGYSLEYYHLATRKGAKSDGVVDHVLVDVGVGARLEKVLPWFERLEIRTGWLNALDRDRDHGGWMTPGGVHIETTVQKWRVGVRNQFYSGKVLMPLWKTLNERHGIKPNRIYKGLPIFASAPRHNYTSVYWNPRLTDGVTLRLEAAIVTDGHKLAFTQLASLGVTLNDLFFKKK